MSGIEETIQLIEEGMKKMTDSFNALNNTCYRDIVKEEQLDSKYLLTEEQEDNMKKSEIKQYYQGVYDKYEEKVKQLENEKKRLEQIFSNLEKAKGSIETMLSNKDSINEAYDMNINNIKITINEIITMINDNKFRTEEKMSKLSLSYNEHIDPRSKKEESERKAAEQAAKAEADRITKLEAEKKAKAELEKKIKEREEKKAKKQSEKIAKLNNKYIVNNIPQLETWSGHQMNKVLYDSDIDGKDSSIFRNKIMNHNQLYFIIIDSDNNVFGHYHSSVIDEIGNNIYDSNIFIFTLNNNGRCGIKKFDIRDGNACTCIYNDNDYYCYSYGYVILQIDTNDSFIYDKIEDRFSGIEKTILTGNYYPNYFTTKRLIVIQMK